MAAGEGGEDLSVGSQRTLGRTGLSAEPGGPPAGAVLVESGGPWAAGTAEFRSGSRYMCWGHRAGMGGYC